jgi:DNA-binding NarL/FixJ family response regulator
MSAPIASHNRPMTQTVLIVDDHPSFRSSARRVLEDGGYEVVGEAHDGTSALTAARELRPAIVLLDVQLPDVDGFEVALRLTRGDDPPAVVLISSHDREDLAGMIEASAARGFLSKADLSGPALAALLT